MGQQTPEPMLRSLTLKRLSPLLRRAGLILLLLVVKRSRTGTQPAVSWVPCHTNE